MSTAERSIAVFAWMAAVPLVGFGLLFIAVRVRDFATDRCGLPAEPVIFWVAVTMLVAVGFVGGLAFTARRGRP